MELGQSSRWQIFWISPWILEDGTLSRSASSQCCLELVIGVLSAKLWGPTGRKHQPRALRLPQATSIGQGALGHSPEPGLAWQSPGLRLLAL